MMSAEVSMFIYRTRSKLRTVVCSALSALLVSAGWVAAGPVAPAAAVPAEPSASAEPSDSTKPPVAPEPSAPADSAAPAVGAVEECADAAVTLSAALAMARACGKPVVVESKLTERTEVVANPDGTETLTSSLVKQRVKRSGVWERIDTNLKHSDGWVVPSLVDGDVRFSAGGSGPMAVSNIGGVSVAVSAPWPLPKPTLHQSTATYPEVLPGVDLVLEAEADGGYTQLVVVKTREAAQNPALERLRFGVKTNAGGVTVNEGGGLEVRDAAGELVLASGASLMWDSKTPPRDSQRGADAGPMDVRPMRVTASTTELVIEPDLDLLRGKETVYPVVIDPVLSPAGQANWTHVNSCGPNTSYHNSYRDQFRVGRVWESTCVWRTVMRFDLTSTHGATIVGTPTLSVVADHTAACAGYDTQLWWVAVVWNWSAFTWNNSQASGFYISDLDTEHFSANEGGACNKPDDPGEFASASLTNLLQGIATNGYGDVTLSLRSANEGDYYGWTYFHPDQTSLNVTYSHPPAAPTPQAFTTTNDCWSVCGPSPAIVRSAQPTLRADVSDPNEGQVSTVFEVRSSASDSGTLVASNASSPVVGSSGSTAQWTVTSSLADGTYYWRARSTDELGVTGGWSSWQTLTVDRTPPAAPSVTSTHFPYRAWGATVGTTGSFTLSAPATGASEFFYEIDGGTQQTVSGSVSDGIRTATVSYMPNTDMVHTILVRQRDQAGNIGDSFTHEFWVSPLPNRCWRWKLDESSGSTASDSGNTDSDGVCATLSGATVTPMHATLSGSVDFDAGYVDNGAVFTGNGQIATAGPVLDTSKSFTVTAWINPSNLASGDQAVLSQDGSNRSRFRLWFDADGNGGLGAWCVSLASDDSGSASEASACAPGDIWPPVEDGWVHLAGIYDSVAGELTVHVMGGLESCPAGETTTVASTGTWQSGGSFVIGRAKVGGASADYWRGGVDEVHAFSRALSTSEVCQLALV